ncbi:pseudouridine synthase [Oligoflexus tunisiensis]|uniref:pseudouridine synthase n=1 Tax=Oligoflexus tunisiensis TaxID=708132 RepID=UPI000B068E02|nr:pseudouridine synthase [Oligoflexus tunisiensis]
MTAGFPILFEDEDLIVIHKPAGILVHRSEATSRQEPAVLQIMRGVAGQHLYPVHRLDRPTSGVLVLARSREMASQLGRQWMEQRCDKTYFAVVRGWAPEQSIIDHPLTDPDDPTAPAQEAVTHLRRLATVELDHAVDRYPRARYSLCEMQPETGRRHQLRRHCKSIFHPIIGDTVYGHGVHNRFFREAFGVSRLLLHHRFLEIDHPRHGQRLRLEAPLDEEWRRLFARFGWT